MLRDDLDALENRAGRREAGDEVDRGGVLRADEDDVLGCAVGAGRELGGDVREPGAFADSFRAGEQLERRSLQQRLLEPLDAAHLDVGRSDGRERS